MKKLLLILGLLLTPTAASAQCTGVFGPNTLCGNLTGTPQPPSQFPASGTVVGPASSTPGDIAEWNNTGGTLLKDVTPTALVDQLCSTTNDFLKRIGGTWQCNNLLNSTNTFSGLTFFGSGVPWVDAQSGSNGCAAADPTGLSDSTVALQCQLNFLYSTFGAGELYGGQGTYLVSGGGITIKGGVQFDGNGPGNSIIKATTDSAVITFDNATCVRFAAIRGYWVLGYNNAGATTSAVNVGASCPVIIEDSYLWLGKYGLSTAGVDSWFVNDFICGNTGAITSSGAANYVRVKGDTCGVSANTGFVQGAPCCSLTVAENTFVDSDFSDGGGFTYTNSVVINDTTGTSAITNFIGTVFSKPILITNAKSTVFLGGELGSTTFTVGAGGGTVSLNGVFAFNSMTIAGNVYCTGVINITACGGTSQGVFTNSITSPVTMTTLGTLYDGPSIAQGSIGTWWASGTATISAHASGDVLLCQLWDGTTTIDSALVQAGTGLSTTMHLSGYLQSPAGNLKISCLNASNNGGTITNTNGSVGKASTISAFRIP